MMGDTVEVIVKQLPEDEVKTKSRSRSGSHNRSRSHSPAKRSSRSHSPAKRSSTSNRDKKRSSSRNRHGSPDGVEIHLTKEDAAFIVGTGGSCKAKIERVSGATLHLDHHLTLLIRGSSKERRRAKKYVSMVSAQRVGTVHLEPSKNEDDDLTIIEVPVECVGYVTGATMRKMEEEWDTLMFFVNEESSGNSGSWEKLAIFGAQRSRRGAELKVMSAVEQKLPGHFTKGLQNQESEAAWGTDTVLIPESDMSYVLGKGGATRKKLARAAGCIMEYVGTVAFLSGYFDERKRGREYLKLLMEQRVGPVHVPHARKRTDCTVVDVPVECVGYVTGYKGRSLRSIEQRTDAFCFMDGGKVKKSKETERLLILGCNRHGRERAREMVMDMVNLKTRRDKYKPYKRSPSPRRGRSRSPARKRPHSHSHSPRRNASHSPSPPPKKRTRLSKSRSRSPVREKSPVTVEKDSLGITERKKSRSASR